ncbi:MAG: NAD-dependent succinate-semialdehyde dehydrogenase [Candidatus Komeilibacteria bacterium]|nr:NAD-dependent succinate-semialdehyde dehydrogenase [Candidatus Komeilibacteria bacterium]
MPYISKNPATMEVLKEFPELIETELQQKLNLSASVFERWKMVSVAERTVLMKKLAEYLRQNKKELGTLATVEMGKPITAAMAEVEKCALTCDFYAENAERFLTSESVSTDATESYVAFEPLGTILAVMPWNFPYWQVFRFAAPTIMAGNVGLLKHASNVPQCALAIERAFVEAGFPNGVFQTLLINSSTVASVIKSSVVKAVTLTGSENAGRSVASIAGQQIKKTVLELGGSDPFIVLADADIQLAAKTAKIARLQNAGQSCIAAKRFILVESVAQEFIQAMTAEFKQTIVGDPMDEKTEVGPMANEQGLQEIVRQVEESVKLGAKIETGGHQIDRPGYFYEPTILSNVNSIMPVYQEEVFGPVAAVIIVKDDQEAIKAVNDTPFGLGASLWTKDLVKAKQLATLIESGSVFINGLVKSDPRLPFGGLKNSGYGRELSSFGIREFINIKTVWIKK